MTCLKPRTHLFVYMVWLAYSIFHGMKHTQTKKRKKQHLSKTRQPTYIFVANCTERSVDSALKTHELFLRKT